MTTLAIHRRRGDWLLYGALLAAGGAMDLVCRLAPAELPFWMPWEFSWPVFLATSLILAWFWRGWNVIDPGERLAWWRVASFVIGLLSFYVVLQTHVDYLAQ